MHEALSQEPKRYVTNDLWSLLKTDQFLRKKKKKKAMVVYFSCKLHNFGAILF